MRGLKSISCLIPILGLVMVSTPTARDVALAQGERPPRVAPDSGEAPDLTNARGASVIEVFKGSQAHRVGVRSGDFTAAVDGQPVSGAEDLWDAVELVKGGEVVVLTVVRSEPGMPIGARIDAVKRGGAGPTSLLPFRSQVIGAARPNGPTRLIPSKPPVTGAVLRRGPTSLLPFQPQVTEAALRAGPTSPIPFQPQATGTVLQDRSAKPIPVLSPVTGAALQDRRAGGGVLVESVEQGSRAWQDGLRRDDVITSVNRSPVRNVAALEAELRSGKNTVVFQVRRGANEIVVVLRR